MKFIMSWTVVSVSRTLQLKRQFYLYLRLCVFLTCVEIGWCKGCMTLIGLISLKSSDLYEILSITYFAYIVYHILTLSDHRTYLKNKSKQNKTIFIWSPYRSVINYLSILTCIKCVSVAYPGVNYLARQASNSSFTARSHRFSRVPVFDQA